MKDYDKLAAELEFVVGESSLLINGLHLPYGKNYMALGKMWAIARRRFREDYGVSVVGVFTYDREQKSASGIFFLDYAPVKNLEIGNSTYEGMYRDNFPAMMARFEAIVRGFVAAEDGLKAYEELYESDELSMTTFDALFNKFLRRIGVRTPEDDRRASRMHDVLSTSFLPLGGTPAF